MIFNNRITTNVGEEGLSKTSSVVVYPSPTNGNNVNIKASGLSSEAQLDIYDLTGRKVFTSGLQVDGGKVAQHFNLTNVVTEGVYSTVITSGADIYRQKIVIR